MGKRILLSAVGGSVAVSYIQHLKKLGHFVIGIDSNDEIAGKYFCDEFIKVPEVRTNYYNVIKDIDFDLFFPFLDEELLYFAGNNIQDQRIVISKDLTIGICINKRALYCFAKENNILVPKQIKELTLENVFVRKVISRGSKHAFISSGSEKYYNNFNYIVQEIIEGQEYTIDLLCNDKHEYVYCVPRKRLKKSNVSLIGQVSMEADLIEFTRSICKLFKFIGPINIQVIKRNNKIYLIEINPRLAGSSILSINAGFDFLQNTIEGYPIKTFKIENNLKMFRYLQEVFIDNELDSRF